VVKKFDDVFSRLDIAPSDMEVDRQTDRQTRTDRFITAKTRLGCVSYNSCAWLV